MFRTEIKEYQPFDVLGWLDEVFVGKELVWQEQYENAKRRYAKKLADEKQAENKRNAKREIAELAHELIDKEYLSIYTYIRQYVARQLVIDLENNPKYDIKKNYQLEKLTVINQQFCSEDFQLVSDFLWELTGGVKRSFPLGQK